MKISVSYLKSILETKKTIKKINDSDADYIHVDLVDGLFCEPKNFSLPLNDLFIGVKKDLDIHLMALNPLIYLESLCQLKPLYITIHVEGENVLESINFIKQHHIKVGLAIKPDSDIKIIEPFLDMVDLVLVLSVHPGLGGQAFLLESINHLKYLKEKQSKHHYLISVDGGINEKTIPYVKDYVDIVVSGSYVCMHEDYNEKIAILKANGR